MEIEEIVDFFTKGFTSGIIFANISILSGWGIRQLIILFKKIILGGI